MTQVAFGWASDSEALPRQARPATVLKLLALAPGHRLHREEVLDQLGRSFIPRPARQRLSPEGAISVQD